MDGSEGRRNLFVFFVAFEARRRNGNARREKRQMLNLDEKKGNRDLSWDFLNFFEKM